MTLHVLMIVSDVPPPELLATIPPGRTYVANLDPDLPATWQGQLVKLLYASASHVAEPVRNVVQEPASPEAES
ncbi:MAG TPA: hypothetical protein VN828_15755 [Acidobacteriaceae bacterium]|nr:hypothetical protein [Acidobacteriaceae bacterium]